MDTVSKKALDKLRSELPSNYGALLAKKIPKIGDAMIRAILRGEYIDKHGVIPEAIKLRDQEQKRIAIRKRALEKLILK